ncbi:MAG: DUF5320 family protein [bacterium]
MPRGNGTGPAGMGPGTGMGRGGCSFGGGMGAGRGGGAFGGRGGGWLGLIVTALGAAPYIINQFRQIKKPSTPKASQLNNQPVPATTPWQERKQLESQLAELKQQMDAIEQRLAELK